MDRERPKPLLAAAFTCERILREADEVISAIRIVDTFTAHESLPDDAPINVSLWAMIYFKSGPATGRYTVSLAMHPQGGENRPMGEPMPIDLLGGAHGTTLGVELHIAVKQAGLYWVDVLVDGEMVTSMPITLRRAPSSAATRSIGTS